MFLTAFCPASVGEDAAKMQNLWMPVCCGSVACVLFGLMELGMVPVMRRGDIRVCGYWLTIAWLNYIRHVVTVR